MKYTPADNGYAIIQGTPEELEKVRHVAEGTHHIQGKPVRPALLKYIKEKDQADADIAREKST